MEEHVRDCGGYGGRITPLGAGLREAPCEADPIETQDR
jgi:hypothetical protein